MEDKKFVTLNNGTIGAMSCANLVDADKRDIYIAVATNGRECETICISVGNTVFEISPDGSSVKAFRDGNDVTVDISGV